MRSLQPQFVHPVTSFRLFSVIAHNMAQEYKLKDVASLSLKPGEKQEVEVEGLDAKVLLVNAGGTVQAVGPKCTHYGAPLAKGILGTNGKLTCPWHGGKFSPPLLSVCNAADVIVPAQLASTPRLAISKMALPSIPFPSSRRPNVTVPFILRVTKRRSRLAVGSPTSSATPWAETRFW